MDRIAWVAGAYLVGTLPSAYLVGRARGHSALRGVDRYSGEADAHILLAERRGKLWGSIAAAADVLKAIGITLGARELGNLDPAWLAAVGIAAVVGHSWPPYLRQQAGRGISATAGVYLVLLPLEMVGMGVLIIAGIFLGFSGLATTIGLVLVPVVAAVRGQPAAFVAMAVLIAGLVAIRRIEGVSRAPGVSLGRAVLHRVVFDSSEAARSR